MSELTYTEHTFSLLNMSSVSAQDARSATSTGLDDLTARARIRDAALHRFGEVGFRAATMRGIAERAGVSAALVVHHFGSKEGLRQEVEDHLMNQIVGDAFAALAGVRALDESSVRAMAHDYAPAMAYIARALTEDAEVGRHLYDRMYRDTLAYFEAGEKAGVIRPCDDPEARAAALLNADLGQTLLLHHTQRVLQIADPAEATLRVAGPVLAAYTDGLFTDARFRDAMKTPHTQETTR